MSTQESSHEVLVNEFINQYFKNKPNTIGLNIHQGDMLVTAIKNIARNEKVDPALKRRIKIICSMLAFQER